MKTKYKTKKRIVLLSGGSLVGQNLLASLTGRREYLTLIALNSIAEEPALYSYDKVYLVPSLVKEKTMFLQKFEEIIIAEDPDLIIPCRDEDVFFLAEYVEKNPQYKSRTIVGPKDVANSMLDKNLSYLFSLKRDLPFVPTIQADSSLKNIELFVEKYGFPLLIKPVKGFASLGVRIITDEDQLKKFTGKSDIIIQRYIGNSKIVESYLIDLENLGAPLFHSFEETKVSIQGCISMESKVITTIITYHKMKNGISAKVEVCDDPEIISKANDWVNSIAECGWRGPINIQSQYDEDGQLFIYEYNGRFTGATSGRVLLGLDEVGIMFRSWLDPEFLVFSSQTLNTEVIRAPESRLYEKDKINNLLENGFWKK